MRYTLLGYKNQKGNFTDKDTGVVVPYDNVLLHCKASSFDNDFIGEETCIIKVKRQFIAENLVVGGCIDVEFVPRGGKCVPCGVYNVE